MAQFKGRRPASKKQATPSKSGRPFGKQTRNSGERKQSPRLQARRPAPDADDEPEDSSSSAGSAPTLRGASAPQTMVRLNKFLAAAGVGSRRECDTFIRDGRVTLGSKVVRELGTVISAEDQTVRFDGEVVRPEPKVYWFVYKPAGVLTTSRDPQGRTTVLDLVPNIGERVYAVGRLDEASTGLLLLTNDGDIAVRLTHPRYGVTTTFEVQVAGRVSIDTQKQLRDGIWGEAGKFKPLRVRIVATPGKSTRLLLIVRDGQTKQIRAVLDKLGHKVMRLERIAIGAIKMRKLKLGEAREATHDEVRLLRESAAGVHRNLIRAKRRDNPVGSNRQAVKKRNSRSLGAKSRPAKRSTRRRP